MIFRCTPAKSRSNRCQSWTPVGGASSAMLPSGGPASASSSRPDGGSAASTAGSRSGTTAVSAGSSAAS